MNKQKLPAREILAILIGEIFVSLVICGIYLLIDKYTYKVLLGVLLGSTVTLLNFIVLSIMTNRVINRFLEARGNEELSDEEAQDLALKFQGQVQNQIKISFIIRTAVLLATLIVAFLVEIFEVLPTVIPLLMLRPILTLSEFIKRKAQK
ncbi:MAG: hypothetical protein IJW38_05365 [Clostridia bacterium]|nr:hypothetical protein [Clostridia bacterium]